VKANDIKLDFVGVGAAKSGTSWLATCLSEHPRVCMAEPKTLNYFCEKAIWPEFRVNNRMGPDWLANRFIHCKSGQLLGEFSPNYLCDPQSPHLIIRHNPECRLIFCFRHPVEAVVSFYHEIRKESPVADTFEEFLDQYPQIQGMGFYHLHAQAFLEVFPRKQCLFLFFDDIKQEPATVLQECFSFLGVESDFIPPSLTSRINERKRPRSKTLLAAINWTRHLLQRYTSGPVRQEWIWKLKLYRLHRWIMQRNLQSFPAIPLSEATRNRLLDLYRDDTRALGQFLGKDLSHWEH